MNPVVHWLYHGTYHLPSAKLHHYSTPDTRANFIGLDNPSLTYEDTALTTVPAFWINPSPEVSLFSPFCSTQNTGTTLQCTKSLVNPPDDPH